MKTCHLLSSTLLQHNFKKLVCCLAMAWAAHFSFTVFAATNTWTGAGSQVPLTGSAEWRNTQNWAEQAAPANNGSADIVFTGSVGLAPDMNDSWNVHAVSFNIAAGAFICGGRGNTLTIQAGGIGNDGLNDQTIQNTKFSLGAPQTWTANLGNLIFLGSGTPINNNSNTLTISGSSNITIQARMSGSGGLIKNGTGSLFLGANGTFNDGFTGTITNNTGTVEFDGPGSVRKSSGVTLNGGVLALNKYRAIGSTTVPMTFNGGKLMILAGLEDPGSPENADYYGTLAIANNSSSIDLDSANPRQASLVFAGGSSTGSGTLTINNWQGARASSGVNDRIYVTTAPDAAFLNAIQFAAFPGAGAARLGDTVKLPLGNTVTGELVPAAAPATWNGGGSDNNWSTANNWAGASPPSANGTGLVIFGGNNRLTPNTDLNWDVLGLAYAGGAGAFTNVGSPITIRSHGITNNSTATQSISNNIVAAAPQTWNAAAGSLSFSGTIDTAGFSPAIDGSFPVHFGPGGGLSGSGGLTKNGANTNTFSAPVTFTAPLRLNSGTIVADVDNVINGPPIIFSGGTLLSANNSQTFGALTLASDSIINLDPGSPAGVFTFAGGSQTGGTLTINGWTGQEGRSGTGDKIFMTTAPSAALLNAIHFTGFSPGAVRMPSGEIVPAPIPEIWTGLGPDDNWSTPTDWLSGLAPVNYGVASLIFAGSARPTPFVDANWDVLSIAFSNNATAFSISGSPLTIRSGGIVNNSSAGQAFGNNIVIGAAETWNASAGPLSFTGTNSNGGFPLTIDGAGVNFGPGGRLSGSGSLTKNGSGTLTVSAPMTFSGAITNNSGTIATPVNSVFNNSQSFTLNGGKLSSLSTTQKFTSITLADNSSSTIDLDPGNAAGVLTFGSGSTGTNCTLTINGWSGIQGRSGTDDKIFITGAPSAALLSAINFTGFSPGATRLASGEIVPFPDASIWTGLGSDNNWSTTNNWSNLLAPVNYGVARIVFAGSTRPTPFTDANWNVQSITFNPGTSPFTNSGSQITIQGGGVFNASVNGQTFANNIVLGAAQTWYASSGALSFSGTNNNAGFALTLDGSKNISFLAGSGLNGTGGLTKNGAGTLSVNSPLAFTGTMTNNSGTIETLANNVLNNKGIIFAGGALTAHSKSQTFKTLTLNSDSSINLEAFNGVGVLTFSGGIRNGGTLTINNWLGAPGSSGSDDRIVITPGVPNPAFLGAVNFAGYPPGAMRLATGEIVPGLSATWDGGGFDNNWDTPENWVGDVVPRDAYNTVRYNLIFDGTNRLAPLTTPADWYVQGITYTNTTVVGATFAGGFTNSGASFVIGTNGILNNRNCGGSNLVSIQDNLVLGGAQTWKATASPLLVAGSNYNNGFTLTIDARSSVIYGAASGALTGTGALIKQGTGALTVNVPLAFTGPITNFGGTIETAAHNVFNNQNIVFSGGALSGLSRTNTFGNLILAANSTINLDPPGGVNVGAGTLTFAAGKFSAGVLTINGWTGTNGNSGLDDKIFITSPLVSSDFLDAIHFTGFAPGAIRLASGEIVPTPFATWVGLSGVNDNWTTPQNWEAGVPPLNNGTEVILFGPNSTNRPTPVTDLSWDVLGVVFGNTPMAFSISGSALTIRGNAGIGIVNNSSTLQIIANNITVSNAQTWKATSGPLQLRGANNNSGFTLTVDGNQDVSFVAGGLSGSGGLIKNGNGTLVISTPMAFGGPITLNQGEIRPSMNNLFSGQNITFSGGTLQASSKSQNFGALTLAANSSINLDAGNAASVLTFASASRTAGTLTINGWTGTAGLLGGGTDDKIMITTAPTDPTFLPAVQFTDQNGVPFAPGALRLNSGEIVPTANAPVGAALATASAGQPVLGSFSRPSNRQFQFSIAGSAGQTYTIQSSTNLTDWVSIATTKAPSNLFTFTDDTATNSVSFYRVLVNR